MAEIVNTEQAQAWNGAEGVHWARSHDRWNAVNGGFDDPLLTAAAITGGDRVLDLGCGAGQTTLLAARRAPHGQAVGLDLSEPMLAEARARAAREGVANASFVHGDAQVHPLGTAAFDAAISRYGVMFYSDPEAAFANIGRALRPGGRLAFVCPAAPQLNEWAVATAALRDFLGADDTGRTSEAPAAPGMFSLMSPDRIRAVLTAAGFTRIGAERAETRGVWGHSPADAARFLLATGPGRHLTAALDAPDRDRAHRFLADRLRVHAAGDGTVRLLSTSWLVTADRPADDPEG